MATNTHHHVETPLEVTNNAAMREVLQAIHRLAASDLSVLITGEHGTGKEWAAHTIHRLSARTNGPFWPFDCASIPPEDIERELFGFEGLTKDGIIIKRGALEDAHGGSLLLNEIASLPSAAQMKVARALEYGTIHRLDGAQGIDVNVRIISTLSEDHNALIRDRTLLKDMFYRISTVIIGLPPLRERREDIPLLIDKFLADLKSRQSNSATGITREALEWCLSYSWPGNVRHLKNSIEYASTMGTGGLIRPEDLPPYLHTHNSDNNHAALQQTHRSANKKK
jgi:DNA-binding NtrC family response regulator